ncbi:hypothetical protein GF345_02565 [Candidatus Woesearchaeota archaeon]|nr:hypothetical protein [Candidatus Woesearchaeota archaeon]
MKNEKRILNIISIIMVVTVFIILPQLMRLNDGNATIMGEEPYYHALAAESIGGKSSIQREPPLSSDEYIHITPYHLLIAGTSNITGMDFALRMIPLICGIFSGVLFFLILKRLGLNDFISKASVVLLASAPVFVFSFIATQDSFAIVLSLAGAYFFLKNKRFGVILSALFFGLASMFSLFNMLLIIVSLLAFSFSQKKMQRRSMFLMMISLIAYSINPGPIFYNLFMLSPNALKQAISDIGGILGIGIFYAILALIGFALTWKDIGKYKAVYAVLAFFAAGFYFAGSHILMYANFIIAFLAAVALERLNQRKWDMQMIKNFTFFIIACGILFSFISYSARISLMPPNQEIEEGLIWLGDNSREDSIVASHYSNGYYIEYYSRLEALIDSSMLHHERPESVFLDAYDLFHATEMGRARAIIERYDIKYIMITDDMVRGDVWQEDGEGLLRLLDNKEVFSMAYDSDEIEVWRYIEPLSQ